MQLCINIESKNDVSIPPKQTRGDHNPTSRRPFELQELFANSSDFHQPNFAPYRFKLAGWGGTFVLAFGLMPGRIKLIFGATRSARAGEFHSPSVPDTGSAAGFLGSRCWEGNIDFQRSTLICSWKRSQCCILWFNFWAKICLNQSAIELELVFSCRYHWVAGSKFSKTQSIVLFFEIFA